MTISRVCYILYTALKFHQGYIGLFELFESMHRRHCLQTQFVAERDIACGEYDVSLSDAVKSGVCG